MARRSFQYHLLVDASTQEEADSIVAAILDGRTFGHEVNAFAYRTVVEKVVTHIDSQIERFQ